MNTTTETVPQAQPEPIVVEVDGVPMKCPYQIQVWVPNSKNVK